ncbi:MAG: cold shock domain-containing protein [Candidatus Nitrotoga sp.]
MTTGTVKCFNDDMRFGLVTPDNGREDLFAHHSEINMSGFKLFKKGQKVVFEVTQIPGGKEVSHIRGFT